MPLPPQDGPRLATSRSLLKSREVVSAEAARARHARYALLARPCATASFQVSRLSSAGARSACAHSRRACSFQVIAHVICKGLGGFDALQFERTGFTGASRGFCVALFCSIMSNAPSEAGPRLQIRTIGRPCPVQDLLLVGRCRLSRTQGCHCSVSADLYCTFWFVRLCCSE